MQNYNPGQNYVDTSSRKAFLLRLPVGRGGVINSPRSIFLFSMSEVGLPLMGDTAGTTVHSLSHDFKLNF